MSPRPSHEFALAAAARISCCAALITVACKPTTTGTQPSNDELEAHDGEQPPIVVEPDLYSNDPELDPSTRKPPISEARLALEACQAQVTDAVAKGTLGPADEACCHTLAESLWAPPPAGVDEVTAQQQQSHDNDIWWPVSGSCCQLTKNSEAACSPWGPPTPPSMLAYAAGPTERLDLRSLARAERPAGFDDVVLDDRLRSAAIATWRTRMVNEHGSAPVFEGLVAQLERLDLHDSRFEQALERARSFAAEERRHGVLCGAVVEALGGAAQAPALPRQPFPHHPDARSELEACLRNLLSICCLSETVAVALIGAERYDMPEGPLRELLTGIWADECGHANFGWRVLPELLARADAETIAGIAEYLRLAFAELESHELTHLPASFVKPAGGEAYGLCDGAEARELFYATVEQVIVPGLEARGVPAQHAWATRSRRDELRAIA